MKSIFFLSLFLILNIIHASSSLFNSAIKKTFIHLTDIHYDSNLSNQSNYDIQCQNWKNDEANSSHSHYDSHCHSSFKLMHDLFQYFKYSPLIHLDMVLWSGGSARYDYDASNPMNANLVFNQVNESTHLMLSTFNTSQTLILPCIGNDDVWIQNLYDPRSDDNHNLETLYEIWEPLFEDDERQAIRKSFLKGGYYFRSTNEFNLIALNTLLWDSSNSILSDCQLGNTPGKEQLEWLSQLLYSTHKNSKKAIIVGHRPPKNIDDESLYKLQCLNEFTNLISRHSQDIIGLYFGHVNADSIQIVANVDRNQSAPSIHTLNENTLSLLQGLNESDVSGLIFTTGSFASNKNPILKAGSLSIQGPRIKLIEQSRLYINLKKSNEMNYIQLDSDCSSSVDYTLNELSLGHIHTWIQKTLLKHPQLFQKYLSCQYIQPEPTKESTKLVLSHSTLLWILVSSSFIFIFCLLWIHYYINHYLDQNHGLFVQQYRWFYRPLPSDFNSDHLRG